MEEKNMNMDEMLASIVSIQNEAKAIRENARGLADAHKASSEKNEEKFNRIYSELKDFIKRAGENDTKKFDTIKKTLTNNKNISYVLSKVESTVMKIEEMIAIQSAEASKSDEEKPGIANLKAANSVASDLQGLIKELNKASADLEKNTKNIEQFGDAILKSAADVSNAEKLLAKLETGEIHSSIGKNLQVLQERVDTGISSTDEILQRLLAAAGNAPNELDGIKEDLLKTQKLIVAEITDGFSRQGKEILSARDHIAKQSDVVADISAHTIVIEEKLALIDDSLDHKIDKLRHLTQNSKMIDGNTAEIMLNPTISITTPKMHREGERLEISAVLLFEDARGMKVTLVGHKMRGEKIESPGGNLIKHDLANHNKWIFPAEEAHR